MARMTLAELADWLDGDEFTVDDWDKMDSIIAILRALAKEVPEMRKLSDLFDDNYRSSEERDAGEVFARLLEVIA